MLLLITASFLVACDDSKRLPKRGGEGIVCTEELKVCPNGDYVARNPDNNCEFDSCSTEEMSGSCGSSEGCEPRIILPSK